MSVVSCWSVRAAGLFLQPVPRIRVKTRATAAARNTCDPGMTPCFIGSSVLMVKAFVPPESSSTTLLDSSGPSLEAGKIYTDRFRIAAVLLALGQCARQKFAGRMTAEALGRRHEDSRASSQCSACRDMYAGRIRAECSRALWHSQVQPAASAEEAQKEHQPVRVPRAQ